MIEYERYSDVGDVAIFESRVHIRIFLETIPTAADISLCVILSQA